MSVSTNQTSIDAATGSSAALSAVPFAPDGPRARALDRRMLVGLGESLGHICERARGIIAFDEAAMAALIERLGAGIRHSPATFGYYYDLVPALLAGRSEEAAAIFAKLAKISPSPESLRLMAIDDPAITVHGDLYQRKMDTDAEVPFMFVAPPDDVFAHFSDRFGQAMELIDQHVPEAAAETRGLIHEIVAAAAPPDVPYQFNGGSSYALWGALFLNAEHLNNLFAVAVGIVHETTHSLLFGLSYDEPLVLNDDAERFESPIRPDPRPMDGVLHATIVSARMHWMAGRLLESGALSAELELEARQMMTERRTGYEAGHAVIAEHGKLSSTGRAVFESARSHMRAAPSI